MNAVAVERFYVVAVEMADGKQSMVKVRGETPADAYRAARSEEGVRRVGKVTEVNESAFHADGIPAWAANGKSDTERRGRGDDRRPGQGGRSADREASRADASRDASRSEPSVRRESLIGFTIAGPRVVHESRKSAVERPFKNLKAPPGSEDMGELPAPPPIEKKFFSPFNPVAPAKDFGPPIFGKPNAPAVQPQAPADDPSGHGASAEEAAAEDAKTDNGSTNETAYRIVKSRRREGHPYLLQRGFWSQQKGKRVFAVNWEKGFDERPKAEKHQSWLEEVSRETAELDSTQD